MSNLQGAARTGSNAPSDQPAETMGQIILQPAGIEVGLFTEHKEIKHSFEFDKMSDMELVQELEREARLLLEHDSGSD